MKLLQAINSLQMLKFNISYQSKSASLEAWRYELAKGRLDQCRG